MIKDLILFTFIILSFIYLKKLILKQSKEIIINNTKLKEKFEYSKFKKIWDLISPVEWVKSLKEIGILDSRKWVIYGVVFGIIWGAAFWQGRKGKPIMVDIGYGKEAHIKLDGHFLHISKKGAVFVEDKEGNRVKQIAVKDIPELQKKLKPVSFEVVPIGVIGYGVGEDNGFEGGAGVSFLRYWQWRLETFLTNKGIYLGNSYKITDNSGIGIGAGKGYRGDSRAIIYYRWEF